MIWGLLILAGGLEVPSAEALQAVVYQLGYLILIAGVLAILAWAAGIERTGAVNASLFMCFVPITAFVVDMVGGYRPTPSELLGAVMAISALFINHHYLVSATPGDRSSILNPGAK